MNQTKLATQLKRFIDSGLKYSRFTNDLYSMLYIEANVFIAHYNREGFYSVRFLQNADSTVALLRTVQKPELKSLCQQLATAIESQMKPEVYTKLYMSVHSKGGI